MGTQAGESVCIVYCSCPDEDCAQLIADRLVGERLAACVSLLPGMRSTYRWKNQMQHDRECLLLIKTREGRLDALLESIRALHPYELPEIIAVPVVAGLEGYLDWVRASTE
jgi:periplasmic divalent cation tolerance protein